MTAMETTLSAKLGKKPDSLLFAWLADELRLQHNLDAALPLVEEGLSRHPDFLPGLLVRGKVLYELNALEEAENVFRKVYRRDPFCLSALRHLAHIATKLNRTNQAEQYWRMLQAMDPLDSSLPALPALRATAHMPRPVPLEEDPFAQLKPAAPLEIFQEGPSALELAGALDAALAGSPSGPTVPEFFPADDDSSVTSSDVGSAISSLFGSASPKAPPQPEAEIGSSSPFSLPLPPSARPEAPETPENAEVNSALDALFGDEEQPLPPPQPTEMGEALGAKDMDSALDALFGGEATEAPGQAQAVEATPGEQPVDLHSALDSLFGDEDEYIEGVPEAPAPTPPELPAVDDAAQELSSSLDQLFGDEETAPEPISSVQWPAEQSEIQQQAVPPDLDSLLSEQLSFKQEDLGAAPDLSDLLSPAPSGDLPDFGSLPTLEGNAPDLQSLFSEQLSSKGDVPDFSADLDAALLGVPGDEEIPGLSSVQGNAPEEIKPASVEPGLEVSGALDELFGDMDDLPEEAPAKAPAAPFDLDSLLSEQLSSKGDVPDFSADLDAALLGVPGDEEIPGLSSVQGNAPEEIKPASAEPGLEVSGALDELFGDMDDLPEEAPAKAPATPFDLDNLLSEQLSSKGDVPDFSADLDAALLGVPGDEEIPGLSSVQDNAPEEIKPASVEPGLEVSGALDELFGDMDDLPEEAPAKAPATPFDLDNLLSEQLSSKGDVPDFSADLDAALLGVPGDEEIPGLSSVQDNAPEEIKPASVEPGLEVSGALDELFGDADDLASEQQPSAKPSMPDLESLLSEQLSSKGDVPDFTADLDAALSYTDSTPSVSPLELGELDLIDEEPLPTPVAPAPVQAAPAAEKAFTDDVADAFSSLFADLDNDVPEEKPGATDLPMTKLTEEESAPASGEGISEVSSALDLLFADEDGLDGLLGASSDAALREQLSVDPKAPVSGKEEPVPQNPTPTLAEIYLEQGLVSKAIATYRDLVAAKPEDAALRARLAQIEKMARREG